MTARVHIITLITGEYADTSRQVVGAYLDYAKALARQSEVEDALILHGLDRESVRARLQAGGEYEEDGATEALAKDLGLSYVYMSYNGFFVSMESIYLNG